MREPRCPDGLGPLGDALRRRIDPASFEVWLGKGEARVIAQTADTVTLAVKSTFCAEQIRNRFEADILACLPGVVGIKFEVKKSRGGCEGGDMSGTDVADRMKAR
jgi:chromosomal replication initiation ATPase DnaA